MNMNSCSFFGYRRVFNRSFHVKEGERIVSQFSMMIAALVMMFLMFLLG